MNGKPKTCADHPRKGYPTSSSKRDAGPFWRRNGWRKRLRSPGIRSVSGLFGCGEALRRAACVHRGDGRGWPDRSPGGRTRKIPFSSARRRAVREGRALRNTSTGVRPDPSVAERHPRRNDQNVDVSHAIPHVGVRRGKRPAGIGLRCRTGKTWRTEAHTRT